MAELILVHEELINGVDNLPNYETQFNELDKGELRIYSATPLTQEQIWQLEQEILMQYVVLTEPILSDAGVTIIKFQKALAPLLIIALAVGGIITAVTGWQIFKTVQMGVPVWVWLVGGAALLFLLLSSDSGKKATGTIINIGTAGRASKLLS